MSQTLLIGLGGTGSRVANNVAKSLRSKSIDINDGNVCCAVLDTNESDNKLIENSGTHIPVIGTSKELTIQTYLDMYRHIKPTEWCPDDTPTFLAQSMIDGASEMRVKSRLAFMDTMMDGTLLKLEGIINDILRLRTDGKIRVMLVSSLSGGTGSGMFIQTALWIRKFFDKKNCQCTIRGILLLPDIFVRNVQAVRDNPRKKHSHYANAYAAIRELNALNKIILKGEKPAQRIVIDGLFDSDNPGNKPIFDFAFFLDADDSRGSSLDSVADYEELAAQLVYMQLYAPMAKNELYSVEDNLYKEFNASSEPVYGACGTAKAVYPHNSVLEYCALSAAKDSLSKSWKKLDAEISARKKDEEADERDGIRRETKLDPRQLYVSLFDEKATIKGGKDTLFRDIKNDVNNVTRDRVNGEVKPSYTDKVEDFVEYITKEQIDKTVVKYGKLGRILADTLPDPKKPEDFPSNVIDTLKTIVEEKEGTVQRCLRDFESEAEQLAVRIVSTVMPLDMGAVSKDNPNTLYGLLVKKDSFGKPVFVHPVAARYLIYKLVLRLEDELNLLTPERSKKKALQGNLEISFDIKSTKKKTETMKDYWDSVGRFFNKKEIIHFIEQYKLFNQSQHGLCQTYQTELLKGYVFQKMKEKLETLVEYVEEFFRGIGEVNSQIKDKIEENVAETEAHLKKTLYVNAKRENKEAKYQSLEINVDNSTASINDEVINVLYGKFCAKLRPEVEDNIPYKKAGIVKSFVLSVIGSYRDLIKEKYSEKIFLNIYDAILEEKNLNVKPDETENYDDIFADEEEETAVSVDAVEAVETYIKNLENLAAPFLIYNGEIAAEPNVVAASDNTIITSSGKALFMPIQTKMTFWGFHPDIIAACPALEGRLGANKAMAQDTAYGANEIYCYRSVYGVKASDIPKFNELGTGGDYYTSYEALVENMIRNNSYVDTPHLDKRWHEFLPYVGREMQKAGDIKFFKSLWLAIGYGKIVLDKTNRYRMVKTVYDDYGKPSATKSVDILYNGLTIRPAEVDKLIVALKNNSVFKMDIIPEVTKLYEEELRTMIDYVDVGVIREGFLSTSTYLNPVDMVVRYSTSARSDINITASLIGAINAIVDEVTEHRSKVRSDEKLQDARIKLMRRIYDCADLTEGKKETFSEWEKQFTKLGI